VNNAPYYGWFSQKSVDQGHPTYIYRDDNGKEYEVTSVSQDPNNHGTLWDDIKPLGLVGTHCRPGRQGCEFRKFCDKMEYIPPPKFFKKNDDADTPIIVLGSPDAD
jgi:hypothetical protein